MTAKTDAERKRKQRSRKTKGGYLLKEIAVLPLAWPAVEKYIEKANRKFTKRA